MKERVYPLYCECFPELPITEENFRRKVRLDECECLTETSGGDTAGFALVEQNTIMLLCIRPEFQGKGLGTSLLRKCEEQIHGQGFDSVILGCGPQSYLFQGVPMTASSPEKFFGKCDYSADTTSVDMAMPLNGFSLEALGLPACPADVTFRIATAADRAALMEAVKDAQPGWVRTFEKATCSVLLAEENGAIAGFCIVDENGAPFQDETTGEIGCVGVVHAARKKGIGLVMAAHATDELKKRGCKKAFLGFTERENWYSKIGYRTTVRFWMGERSL